MDDLRIELLSLNITSAGGHEHRIRPIAARAAAIFAQRLEGFCAEVPGLCSRSLHGISASPAAVDLSTMTDEHAADSIASAWLDAVTLKLRT